MRRLIMIPLALLTVTGLFSACSSDKVVKPVDDASSATMPDITLPAGVTLPPGVTIPDIQNEDEAIEYILDQFENSGIPVDRECMRTLLKDPALRKQLENANDLSDDVVKLFISCMTSG